MHKSPATKKRIFWGRILKRMRENGTIKEVPSFPMLLKRSFLDVPFIHTRNRHKIRYRLLRRLDG